LGGHQDTLQHVVGLRGGSGRGGGLDRDRGWDELGRRPSVELLLQLLDPPAQSLVLSIDLVVGLGDLIYEQVDLFVAVAPEGVVELLFLDLTRRQVHRSLLNQRRRWR
jgi:hypothetical protein